MAFTLLTATTEVLKKVSVLDSASSSLSSLTDSARQPFIDLAVQAINEVLDELYAACDLPKPLQLKAGTITLVLADKSYALASDFVMLRPEFNLIDRTNNHVIHVIEDFREIIVGDLGQDDTGLPTYCAISPIDGELVFDRAPTAAEVGRVYYYYYDREMVLDTASDTFPLNDMAVRALIPAAAEVWKRYRQNNFDAAMFRASLGRAARLMSRIPPRTSWTPQPTAENVTDPLSQ